MYVMRKMFQSYYGFTWSEFVSWFLGLPLFGQILVVIGIATLTVLVLIGVYYLLKGIGYLIYYLFKGIYYLLKGIATGIYMLLNGLYHLLTGKQENKEISVQDEQEVEQEVQEILPPEKKIEIIIPEEIAYCPECGVELSDSMKSLLSKEGYAYCSFCGKRFNKNLATAHA